MGQEKQTSLHQQFKVWSLTPKISEAEVRSVLISEPSKDGHIYSKSTFITCTAAIFLQHAL